MNKFMVLRNVDSEDNKWLSGESKLISLNFDTQMLSLRFSTEITASIRNELNLVWSFPRIQSQELEPSL